MSHPHAFKDLQRIPGVGPSIAEDLYGLQIGLINIIRSKDRFPIRPIVNWKFDE